MATQEIEEQEWVMVGSQSAQTTSDIEKQWYVALYEEDCLPLMDLLKEDPWLLKVGWKSDNSRNVQGRRWNYWLPEREISWKGRTALHVAARRGCVALVKQVLELCNLDEIAKLGEGDDIKYDLLTLNVYEEKLAESIIPNEQGETTTSGDTHKPSVQQAATNSDRYISEAQVSIEQNQCNTGNSNLDKASSDLVVTRQELLDLLLCKDGEYNVDALALAVINTNENVQDLLIYAMGQCEYPHYLTGRTTFSVRSLRKDEEDYSRKRLHLREVTHRVINEFLAGGGVEGYLLAGEEYQSLKSNSACRKYFFRAFRSLESFGGNSAWRKYLSDHKTWKEDFERHLVRNREHNFLPKDEYLFHTLCCHTQYYESHRAYESHGTVSRAHCFHILLVLLFGTLWKELAKEGLERFVLGFYDAEGRPPLHAAIDVGQQSKFFAVAESVSAIEDVINFAVKQLDSAGRSPLYRAASTGAEVAVKDCLTYLFGFNRNLGDSKIGVNNSAGKDGWIWRVGPFLKAIQDSVVSRHKKKEEADVDSDKIDKRDLLQGGNVRGSRFHRYFNLSKLSKENGFRYFSDEPSVIDGAIIHGHERCFGLLFKQLKALETDDAAIVKLLRTSAQGEQRRPKGLLGQVKGDPLALAGLVENNMRTINYMLKENLILPNQSKVLFVAASLGYYELLEVLLDTRKFDPFIEDDAYNSLVHYALNKDLGGYSELVKPHLLDYFSCSHLWDSIHSWDSIHNVKAKESPILQGRQGCVNLLLQAGCEIFKTNKDKQVPYSRGSLSRHGEFRKWWHDKQGKEFEAIQNGLSIASNAISVTAVLVATASYVGPLQPPLGLGTTGITTDQMQYENGWVATFIFSDTLSFYLAIVAIILSLIPALPVPQQSMVDELRRTRLMVTMAVVVLFLSIICVLIAFASSSLAVVSHNIVSGLGGQLTIITLCLGGFLVLLAFFLFFIRLLGICFPKKHWIRSMYRLTAF